MVVYTTAKTTDDLKKILQLQGENLEVSITEEELHKEGFVTVHHDLELLTEMNHPYPHIIAKDGEEVIGYVLVMLKAMQHKIPILVSMFQQINSLSHQGMSLSQSSYFIMGQVCIKKEYRGKGIFKGLYDHMKKRMSSHFQYIITEVAMRNQRSIRAHEKQGFSILHTFRSKEGEDWVILILKLFKNR